MISDLIPSSDVLIAAIILAPLISTLGIYFVLALLMTDLRVNHNF